MNITNTYIDRLKSLHRKHRKPMAFSGLAIGEMLIKSIIHLKMIYERGILSDPFKKSDEKQLLTEHLRTI